ncbi:MAG: septum formation protein Maf [Proteobacteria bacterium]|nr:septum formation protein Maf [Pseudomonadota bacterium]
MSALPRLLLASTSPYRRELLARLGVPFEAVDPGVPEEVLEGELPVDRARRLALAKAQAVAGRHPDCVVIGSDQVAACQGRILDKPQDAAHTFRQLAFLSGQRASFYTACAVLGTRAQVPLLHVDTTSVNVRSLSTAEIERYIAREAAFGCAGGFKAEALGISLFESIDSSDPTALVGLPLIWLAGALRGGGYPVP